MPCHYVTARDKSFDGTVRGFQMFVEIASRMGGRGVERETRRDVKPGEEARYPRWTVLYAEYRLVYVYPACTRNRRVNDNAKGSVCTCQVCIIRGCPFEDAVSRQASD